MKRGKYIQGFLSFGKISGGYFITSIINNALPFILLPILTHYIQPESYANITLFTTYIAIVSAFSGPAIHAYIANIFFDNSGSFVAKNIGNATTIIGGFSLFFLLLILLTFSLNPNLLGLNLFWLLMIPLTSFCQIFFRMALGVMRNKTQVLTFSYHQIGNTFLNSLISIVLVAILLIGWEGRVLGISLSFAISAGFALYYLKKQELLKLSPDIRNYKRLFKFVITLAPNSLQNTLVSKVGIIFIQLFFAKEILGIYSVGFQVAFSIMILVSTLNLSWAPFFFKQLSKKDFNKYYVIRMLYVHIAVVAMGVIFINVFGGTIIRIMTSEAYYSAVKFIPWLSVGFLFNAIVSFVKPAFIKANLEKDVGLISILNLILMILLNFLFCEFFGSMGVAYAFFATYLVMLLLVVLILVIRRKALNLPWLRALIFFKND
jgi:O-antigen/teichoic acid export membrane protein